MRYAKSNYCKTSYSRNSYFDPSIATAARNEKGLLEPTEILFQFGMWVVERIMHLLSFSFVRLSSIEIMIESVYQTYLADHQFKMKLPDFHPIFKFIIKRLGKRILSDYCSRLSKTERSLFVTVVI